MAGLREPTKSTANLEEQLLRTTLRNVRSQGHPYVDLREDEKIFYCTLCRKHCHDESSLSDHLKSNEHSVRQATAQATLMKSNPWPFSDGVLFFHPEPELVIPAVLQKDEVSDLVVQHIGVGVIGARFCQKNGVRSDIRRMWCEWIGKKGLSNEENIVPEHNFAVVIFPNNYNLGRKGLLDRFRHLLTSSSPHSEAEDNSTVSEDGSEASTNQGDSPGEEDLVFLNILNLKMMLSAKDDHLVLSRILSSKTLSELLKRELHRFSERVCDICKEKMLPDKDVAALLNMGTGKLVCSSRNNTGAFHLFHASCLIYWILLFEVETYKKQSVEPDSKINSVFCPECQGTGIRIDGKKLEKPIFRLEKVNQYKDELSDAHRAWMKSPELLQNCSMGFGFPSQSDEQCLENVSSLKLLHFYRANCQ